MTYCLPFDEQRTMAGFHRKGGGSYYAISPLARYISLCTEPNYRCTINDSTPKPFDSSVVFNVVRRWEMASKLRSRAAKSLRTIGRI
jgi:hypothetical protein